jgi:hypothetical protein
MASSFVDVSSAWWHHRVGWRVATALNLNFADLVEQLDSADRDDEWAGG